DGGEAIGQAGHGQGVDAGGQGIAHVQVLHNELAVAQLEPGFHRGCKECMLSLYAPTYDKTFGPETPPLSPTAGLPSYRRPAVRTRGTVWRPCPNRGSRIDPRSSLPWVRRSLQ